MIQPTLFRWILQFFEDRQGASRPIQAARTQIQSQQAPSQTCQGADLSLLADGLSPSPVVIIIMAALDPARIFHTLLIDDVLEGANYGFIFPF